MRKLLFTIAFVITALGFSFAQEVGINLIAIPGSVAQGQSGYVLVDVCNNDPGPVDSPLNKVRPLISLPSNVVITTVTAGDGSPLTEWSILSQTTGTVRLNNLVSLVNPECYSFRIYFTGTVVSSPGPVTGTLGFNGPQTVGNVTGNDNSTSSIMVTAPVATPPVATNDNAGPTDVPIVITVLTNDTPGSSPIDPTKVMLIDPSNNTPSTSVTIPGEGTYTVNTTTGEVTFTPDPLVTTTITSTIQYTITDTNNLTSPPATISVNVTPLPVTLVSFTAKKEGSVALLNWATTEETNSDHFEIQHSVSGKDWVNVGEVASSGESNVLKNYSFSHVKPVHGQNLYRLKMIDRDQTFAFSRIQSVSFEGIAAADLSVYPNPSTDKLFIRDNGTVKEVVINNLNGNSVYRASSNFAVGNGLIDVTSLPQGMYIVKVTRQNGLISTSKIVVNK